MDLPQTRTPGLLYPKQTQMHADVIHLVLPESQDLGLQSCVNFMKTLKTDLHPTSVPMAK